MKQLFLFAFLLFMQICPAQNPLVKIWDSRFGGTLEEGPVVINKTADNGFIIGASSRSNIGGEKSENTEGSFDYWIVKLDALGQKQWDRDFGGTDVDYLTDVLQTSDGGFILGGFSYSAAGGDKSQNGWGLADYWIIKTDPLGNKLWDKTLGGTGSESYVVIVETQDNGFLVCGTSLSGIGGDKTEDTFGADDFWIVRLDAAGTKLWDRDFGGNNEDRLRSVWSCSDKGLLLCGSSDSGISGSKSDVCRGADDYWMVKIDSLGIQQWDKTFGGSNDDWLSDVTVTTDNGFLFAGYSESGISWDKSQASWGSMDYWIIKTDSAGNKLWDKDIGGSDLEELNEAVLLPDGGFLLTGDSYSPVSGNKTESNLGSEQIWSVRTDSSGNVVWDKTVFTNGHDEISRGISDGNNCFVFANVTSATIAGYKTQDNLNGSLDCWLVKFCDSTLMLPVAIALAPHHLCPGTCTSFLNQSLYAAGFQWYFPGGFPDTSTAVNPSNICYSVPGSYDLMLIATNANGSDTLLLTDYITIFPVPAPQSVNQNEDTLFAVSGSASYQWYLNGSIISGATNHFYIATSSGDYNVVATDSNGCEVEAVIYNVIAGIQSAADNGQLTVFPNPVGNQLGVGAGQFAMEQITIYNLLGERVVNYPLDIGSKLTATIEVTDLHPGLYFVEVISEQNKYYVKFLKQ